MAHWARRFGCFWRDLARGAYLAARPRASAPHRSCGASSGPEPLPTAWSLSAAYSGRHAHVPPRGRRIRHLPQRETVSGANAVLVVDDEHAMHPHMLSPLWCGPLPEQAWADAPASTRIRMTADLYGYGPERGRKRRCLRCLPCEVATHSCLLLPSSMLGTVRVEPSDEGNCLHDAPSSGSSGWQVCSPGLGVGSPSRSRSGARP